MNPLLFLSILSTLLLLLTTTTTASAITTIGVTYDPTSSTFPPPEHVITTLLSLNITSVHLVNPTPASIQGFHNTNISLFLTIPNHFIPSVALHTSTSTCSLYLYTNVHPFHQRTKFSLNSVGSVGSDPTNKFTSIMTNTFPPSSSEFIEPVGSLRFMQETNSYPYNVYRVRYEIPVGLALFGEFPFNFRDDVVTGVRYENLLFYMMVDGVIAVLAVSEKESLPVVVADTGWYNDGKEEGVFAEKYVRGLVRHLRTGVGSQMRKEGVSESYLYSLFDDVVENGTKCCEDGIVWKIMYHDIAAFAVSGKDILPVVVVETGWYNDGKEEGVFAEKYVRGLVRHLRTGVGSQMRKKGVSEAYSLLDGVVANGTKGGEDIKGCRILYRNMTHVKLMVVSVDGAALAVAENGVYLYSTNVLPSRSTLSTNDEGGDEEEKNKDEQGKPPRMNWLNVALTKSNLAVAISSSTGKKKERIASFLLAMSYIPAFCSDLQGVGEQCKFHNPPRHMTAHGVWPLAPSGDVLSAPDCSPPFEQRSSHDFVNYVPSRSLRLDELWPSIKIGQEDWDLWAHEYNAHGRCRWNKRDYIHLVSRTIKRVESIRELRWPNPIQPSMYKSYTHAELLGSLVHLGFQITSSPFHCKRYNMSHQYLSEIRFCFMESDALPCPELLVRCNNLRIIIFP